MTTLAQDHDCLLLDLDGTVFRGQEATTGAVETLAAVEARTLYVTNNASRGPDEVAQHLIELGFAAEPDDVVTSAQSAARLLAAQLPSGSAVLVVGTDSLAAEVRNVGLHPVRMFSDDPVAVVQGHSPETGWTDLAEAALAIRAGALWVAANVDRTLPSERGLLPGNGSMVAALRTATDQRAPGGGQARTDAAERRAWPRTVRQPAGRGRPPGHRHRGRQRGGAAQPAGAHRRQHRGGHGVRASPRSARTTSPPICVRSMRSATRYGSDRIRRGTSRSAATR